MYHQTMNPMSTMKYYPTNNILPSSNAKCTCVSFRIQYPQLFVWFFWISFLLSRVESMNDKWLVKFNWLRLWSTVILLSSLDQNINMCWLLISFVRFLFSKFILFFSMLTTRHNLKSHLRPLSRLFSFFLL